MQNLSLNSAIAFSCLLLLACPPDDRQKKASDAGHSDNSDAASNDAGNNDDPLLQALCDLLLRCQDNLGPAFADQPSCLSYFADRYRCQHGAQRSAADETSCRDWLVSASCTQAELSFGCIALMSPLGCSDPMQQFAKMGAPSCGAVFQTERAADGERCDQAVCEPGLFCKRGPVSSVCSVCLPLADLGQPCQGNPISPLYQPCVAGAYCNNNDDLCRALLANGESCQSDNMCASKYCKNSLCSTPGGLGEEIDLDHQCLGFLARNSGRCQARAGEGASCQFDTQCFFNMACSNSVCTPFQACVERQVGEPCVTEPSGCVSGAFCNNTADPQVCQSERGLGESCEYTEDCGDDAYCGLSDWVCTAYSGVGGDCAGALLCASGLYCDDSAGSTCTELRADGAGCDYNFQCLSGHCDQDQCGPSPACTMP